MKWNTLLSLQTVDSTGWHRNSGDCKTRFLYNFWLSFISYKFYQLYKVALSSLFLLLDLIDLTFFLNSGNTMMYSEIVLHKPHPRRRSLPKSLEGIEQVSQITWSYISKYLQFR